MIYNNAYRAFAGSRHPSIPGTNVLEGSHEVADFNANVMQKVYRERGMLSYEDQELTLIRDGTPQILWANLEYSPARDDEGTPIGVVAARELILEQLGELGYTARQAVDGVSGLEVVRSGRRIDLLITDIGLPGLNGRQLADAARTLRPTRKVLFMTGYAANAALAAGFLDVGMEMITKSFAMEALATRIRAMLRAI